MARLVGAGRTNAGTGRELHMSTATGKAYMTRILAKLGLDNRVQVALLVNDAGEVHPRTLFLRIRRWARGPGTGRVGDLRR